MTRELDCNSAFSRAEIGGRGGRGVREREGVVECLGGVLRKVILHETTF